MTDHYDEMSVAPDAAQAEALRQRLHARLASTSRDGHKDRPDLRRRARLDPQPDRVPLKEIYVSDNSPTNEGRNRRRLVTAAAAVVAVIGLAGIAFAVGTNSGDDETPAPADAPTVAPTTVAPTTVAPTTETGAFAGSEGDVPWTVTMPAGWENSDYWNSGWGVVKGDPLFGFVTAEVDHVYADPCLWELVPPFGPTVDDLVAAWADVPGFDATATTDVTVDGYAGKQIEFTVPDYNDDQCEDGRYGIWQEPFAFDDGPHYWAQGPDQHNQVWILDVDGTRLVILASYFPDTSPQDRAAVDEMLASIQIS
jgi:hypothetical protein